MGLFGGGYTNWLKNQPPPDLVALGAPADFSTDGTGLPPSVTMTGNLPMHSDPAASLQQVLSYTDNGLGLSSPTGDGPHVAPSFIFGEENNKQQQDPTRTTLPIPTRAPGGKNIYANTGITTWGGVDMGGHSVEDLKRWGAGDADIATLTPAMGLKGEKAKAYVNQQEYPHISAASAEAIRQGALADRTTAVQKAYDGMKPPVPFAQLPGDVQTAIVDLAYQTPGITTGSAPNFWKQVTTGDWGGAVNNLNHYYGPTVQPTPHDLQRRKDEAGLIQRNLDQNGRLILPSN